MIPTAKQVAKTWEKRKCKPKPKPLNPNRRLARALLLAALMPTLAQAETHCGLIDASTSSGVRQTATGQWPVLTELRLETTLNSVANPAGVYIHSKAVGGSDADGFRLQWDELQEQANLPGSAKLDCIILGISGAVVNDLYGNLNKTLSLAAEIKATGLRVLMLNYPPSDRLGKEWLAEIGIPGLAAQGLTLTDYENARQWYATQVPLVADAYINPWREITTIPDGVHPTWLASYKAAITIADAIIYNRVNLP